MIKIARMFIPTLVRSRPRAKTKDLRGLRPCGCLLDSFLLGHFLAALSGSLSSPGCVCRQSDLYCEREIRHLTLVIINFHSLVCYLFVTLLL